MSRRRVPASVKHVCRTRECWHEHATNPDGSDRCLWSSRDGITPVPSVRILGRAFCSQPSYRHCISDDPTPHTFELAYEPEPLARPRVPILSALITFAIAFPLASWLISVVTR